MEGNQRNFEMQMTYVSNSSFVMPARSWRVGRLWDRSSTFRPAFPDISWPWLPPSRCRTADTYVYRFRPCCRGWRAPFCKFFMPLRRFLPVLLKPYKKRWTISSCRAFVNSILGHCILRPILRRREFRLIYRISLWASNETMALSGPSLKSIYYNYVGQ